MRLSSVLEDVSKQVSSQKNVHMRVASQAEIVMPKSGQTLTKIPRSTLHKIAASIKDAKSPKELNRKFLKAQEVLNSQSMRISCPNRICGKENLLKKSPDSKFFQKVGISAKNYAMLAN